MESCPPPSETEDTPKTVQKKAERPRTKSAAVVSANETNGHRFLAAHPMFSQLSPSELKTLADSSRFATVNAGDYITVEGDDESLYGFIVVSGRLSMMKTSINGKELVVELLGPGDIFGLLLTLTLEKSLAELSARAQSVSEVLWIPVKNLLPALNAHPKIYREIISYLLHSLQSSYRISRGLAHDRVEVRIAALLSVLVQKFSRPPPEAKDFTVDITRQQIADLTGTTPETAIRVTRSMQRDGLIDISHPGIVRVLKLDALNEIAEGQ